MSYRNISIKERKQLSVLLFYLQFTVSPSALVHHLDAHPPCFNTNRPPRCSDASARARVASPRLQCFKTVVGGDVRAVNREKGGPSPNTRCLMHRRCLVHRILQKTTLSVLFPDSRTEFVLRVNFHLPANVPLRSSAVHLSCTRTSFA